VSQAHAEISRDVAFSRDHDHHTATDRVVKVELWAGPTSAGVSFVGGRRFRRKPTQWTTETPEMVYAITRLMDHMRRATYPTGRRVDRLDGSS